MPARASSGHSAGGVVAHHVPAGDVRHEPPAWCHSPQTSWRLASQKKPLLRTTPGHSLRSSASKRSGWNGRRAR